MTKMDHGATTRENGSEYLLDLDVIVLFIVIRFSELSS